MTEAMLTGDATGPAQAKPAVRLLAGLWPAILLHSVITLLLLMALNLPNATDYIGADNDDGMRLVQVRDLMAGQNWFDLMQYRLGLGDGTPMHWSRLIDLPIASLISAFELFLPQERAEALAATVWPLTLAVLLLTAMGLAGRRLGGPVAMHIALGLTAMFLVTGSRFLPGALDHHNVQLVLVATIVAMLADQRFSLGSYALAGLAAGLAVAIGAETMPQVAAACLIVACLWLVHGASVARPVRAFCLALMTTVSAAFFLTVPRSLYTAVTCDSLSLGFYSIVTVGAASLLAATVLASRAGLSGRLLTLAAAAVPVVATAVTIAPQCLGNPLTSLDPMLHRLWLANVTEARSIFAIARLDPAAWGAFYAVGLIGFAIALFSAIQGRRPEQNGMLAAMIGISWLVAALQVRGGAFSNLIAILPFSMLIADLRRLAHAGPHRRAASVFYPAMALAASPAMWAMAGLAGTEGLTGFRERAAPASISDNRRSCGSPEALSPLNGLTATTIAAPSDLGVPILRYTPHRVLSAPYHRNQGGMLTELYIGLSNPAQAEAFLRGAHVGILAFCRGEWQTKNLAKLEPQGLYAQLTEGIVPAYLEPVSGTEASDLQLFRVKP